MTFDLKLLKYKKRHYYFAKFKVYIINYVKKFYNNENIKWPNYPTEEIKTLNNSQNKKLKAKKISSDLWVSDKTLIERWNLSQKLHYLDEDKDPTAWLNGKNGKIVTLLSKIIEKHEIKKCFNFGCLHPLADFTLAKKYKDLNFVGFDRNKKICEINNKKFKLKNLFFRYGNLLNTIKKEKGINLFFHSKTAMFCFPDFIDNIYRDLAKNQVKYIVIFEWLGYSMETSSFYKLSYNYKKSRVMRDNIYAHNYPYLLKKNGYKILEGNLIKIPQRKLFQKDVHLCFLLAQKET